MTVRSGSVIVADQKAHELLLGIVGVDRPDDHDFVGGGGGDDLRDLGVGGGVADRYLGGRRMVPAQGGPKTRRHHR